MNGHQQDFMTRIIRGKILFMQFITRLKKLVAGTKYWSGHSCHCIVSIVDSSTK